MIKLLHDGENCPNNIPLYVVDTEHNWHAGCVGCTFCFRNKGYKDGITKCLTD